MASFQLSTAVSALIRVARPEFKRRHDRVAYAVHAYYLCQGYTLVGVGDAGEATAPPEDAPEVPIDGWNDNGELYVFTYAHSKKEMQPVVVKCICMGNILVVCVSSLVSDGSVPRTLNVNIQEVTTEAEDIMQGYTSLDDLVGQFVAELGEYRVKTEQKETLKVSEEMRTETQTRSLMEPMPPRRDLVGSQADWMPDGLGTGSQIGLRDPRFAPHLRHPELQPGRGVRYDPIGPPGMPGYFPDDYYPHNRNRLHPDIQPPGPGKDFDPDHMFG